MKNFITYVVILLLAVLSIYLSINIVTQAAVVKEIQEQNDAYVNLLQWSAKKIREHDQKQDRIKYAIKWKFKIDGQIKFRESPEG